ncbi:hypothetical protein L484_026058 [Morus notabilis]|uniref:Uncharacterized protein n=1 Tax=Morus notabilis TaxID=981085 RepID=W9RG29_9ROSA|nr:hypothetical protein L484_026058 [Morus notabilis]
MTVEKAVPYGFILPLMELTYKKAKQEITYSLLLEVQLVMCFFATAFCTAGMIVNKDFQLLEIARSFSEHIVSSLMELILTMTRLIYIGSEDILG